MTCKDCIHFDICNSWHKNVEAEGLVVGETSQQICNHFKNKEDFQEVKHGEWEYCCTHNNKKYYRCSVCHYSYLIYENTQYCQHCGVKMDGGGNSDE